MAEVRIEVAKTLKEAGGVRMTFFGHFQTEVDEKNYRNETKEEIPNGDASFLIFCTWHVPSTEISLHFMA